MPAAFSSAAEKPAACSAAAEKPAAFSSAAERPAAFSSAAEAHLPAVHLSPSLHSHCLPAQSPAASPSQASPTCFSRRSPHRAALNLPVFPVQWHFAHFARYLQIWPLPAIARVLDVMCLHFWLWLISQTPALLKSPFSGRVAADTLPLYVVRPGSSSSGMYAKPSVQDASQTSMAVLVNLNRQHRASLAGRNPGQEGGRLARAVGGDLLTASCCSALLVLLLASFVAIC